MTPKEALENLARAAALYRGTLAEHQALQESLRVLSELIPQPQEESK